MPPCKGILLSLVREYPSNGILSGLHAKALADGVESGRGGMGLVLGTRVKLGRTQARLDERFSVQLGA
jgi:hypothetical protein